MHCSELCSWSTIDNLSAAGCLRCAKVLQHAYSMLFLQSHSWAGFLQSLFNCHHTVYSSPQDLEGAQNAKRKARKRFVESDAFFPWCAAFGQLRMGWMDLAKRKDVRSVQEVQERDTFFHLLVPGLLHGLYGLTS